MRARQITRSRYHLRLAGTTYPRRVPGRGPPRSPPRSPPGTRPSARALLEVARRGTSSAWPGSSRRASQALRLLVLRDVQEELDDDRALVGQHLLEVADVRVAGLPAALRHQVVDPHDQHVLVVAAVEDRRSGRRRARGGGRATGSRGPARRSVGALNDATCTPAGSMPSNALRMAPPLPEVSIPWSTTSSLWRPSA